MDILYLLIPLSVVLVFLIIGVFAWAVNAGQFDDLEREGERILGPDESSDERDRQRLSAIKGSIDPGANNVSSRKRGKHEGAIDGR